ncbi:ABC-type multidrug transport system ATPase subunit/ABC-type transporter Mla maintaining outer membrane lipid asymmetry permease subunit MlaE [Azospirillum fermentarium]|uniref:ATP-binding cassette domain-containing protein n=1 Tax=Azospirillum fermentarium TaxID=1233114 RepID=UPI002226906C|nr:ATP-binding cassette domain-containing protein [Azospirillum fermentarium]MCW2249377.1 ABC-type multidrug transport system ATPase subunit/ABC-type transporter Mla maintaining outer membrane lipid asymmetry permease subunit MlaE [Azospirillum fermentarium]
MTRTAHTLVIDGLTIHRPSGDLLVRDATFTIGPAEVVLLVGPSGSGKSTIVKLLGGLLETGTGGWRVAGRLECGGAAVDLGAERSTVGGIVFQDHALFNDLSALENLRIAADHARHRPDAGLIADATALLGDIAPDKSVASCSGGQRQRLAIARTLLADRPVLLFDEPNSGLDVAMARRLGELIRDLCRTMGKPALIVAHHVKDLLPVADRVLLFDTRRRCLVEVPRDAEAIEAELLKLDGTAAHPARPQARRRSWPDAIGHRPRGYWFGRYMAEYFWELCVSPLMLVYMGAGALIMGFVSMWFGFHYNSFGGYLKSLLHDETLVGLGLVQGTVAVPLISSILFVARNNAIIAADIGNRVLSSQFQAMDNLRITARGYIVSAILVNMVIGSLMLLVLSLGMASWASMQTWHVQFPMQNFELWRSQFFRKLLPDGIHPAPSMMWVLLKVALSALLAGGAAIVIGGGRKESVLEINTAIARAIIVGVTLTLAVHAVISVLTL